jgi:hypothetical protein
VRFRPFMPIFGHGMFVIQTLNPPKGLIGLHGQRLPTRQFLTANTAVAYRERKMSRVVDDLSECYLALTVRSEKAPVHSGRQTRPGTGSLHPVAIEAAAEVTKRSEPSV